MSISIARSTCVMRQATVFRAGFIVCLGLLSGCGDAGNQRISVEGTVTRGGQPVIGGALNMLPEEGTKGPAVSAVIRDGKVKLTGEDGPFPGKYKAILREDSADAFRRDGGLEAPSAAAEPSGGFEPTVEKSPEIRVEFSAGSVNQTVFAF